MVMDLTEGMWFLPRLECAVIEPCDQTFCNKIIRNDLKHVGTVSPFFCNISLPMSRLYTTILAMCKLTQEMLEFHGGNNVHVDMHYQ